MGGRRSLLRGGSKWGGWRVKEDPARVLDLVHGWWTAVGVVDKTADTGRGTKKGSHEEDERGWITHERGGSFWRRSRIWAQSE